MGIWIFILGLIVLLVSLFVLYLIEKIIDEIVWLLKYKKDKDKFNKTIDEIKQTNEEIKKELNE